MPFQSKAQVRKFGELVSQGKMSQGTFHEWATATPSIKGLPNLIHPPKKAPKIRAPGKPTNMLKAPAGVKIG